MSQFLNNEENIEISPSGIVSQTGNRFFYYLFKRLMDILLSSIALIFFSPLMLVIAILIRLDSQGPILFVQKRVGTMRREVNGQYQWEMGLFSFYKFRTMLPGADSSIHKTYIKALIDNDLEKILEMQNGNSTIHKLANDPRVTHIGNFLRRTSLDELPQFFNVFKGDMSLVGPRPAIPYEVEMYKPWYHRRLEAKPGITGLWQVKARNMADFDEMMSLDIEYIEKQSFWLDFKILFKTPLTMVIGRGAR
jgi:lipopolysaccharide/colanic/teichoic acid biosynthesis glycosyltransferase